MFYLMDKKIFFLFFFFFLVALRPKSTAMVMAADSHLLPDTLPTALRGPVRKYSQFYSQNFYVSQPMHKLQALGLV